MVDTISASDGLLSDLLMMMYSKGLLFKNLKGLLSLEIARKKERNLELEAFREDSPAVKVLMTLFELEALQALRNEFSEYVSVCIMKQIRWNPKSAVGVVEKSLKHLISQVSEMPQELLELFRALMAAIEETANPSSFTPGHAASSILFLRFFCPGLVAPKVAFCVIFLFVVIFVVICSLSCLRCHVFVLMSSLSCLHCHVFIVMSSLSCLRSHIFVLICSRFLESPFRPL